MQGQLLYSILIPVYNVEKYVSECLESVIRQTYKDFEVIIIDDGSTDRSRSICENYAEKDKRIKVFHQENKGLMLTRKQAILKAKGKYCLFLDSDDLYVNDLLETLDSKLKSHESDIVVFNISRLYKGGIIKESKKMVENKTILSRKEFLNEFLKTDRMNSIVIKAIKRELIISIIDEVYVKINYAEDFLQTFCFLDRADDIQIINKCLYIYRIRKSSLIHTINLERIYETLGVKKSVFNKIKDSECEKESLDAFLINTLDELMDSIYKFNNLKKNRKLIIKDIGDICTNDDVCMLLKDDYIAKLPLHNRIRANLYKKHSYTMLLILDKIIMIVQRIIKIFKQEKAFD